MGVEHCRFATLSNRNCKLGCGGMRHSLANSVRAAARQSAVPSLDWRAGLRANSSGRTGTKRSELTIVAIAYYARIRSCHRRDRRCDENATNCGRARRKKAPGHHLGACLSELAQPNLRARPGAWCRRWGALCNRERLFIQSSLDCRCRRSSGKRTTRPFSMSSR